MRELALGVGRDLVHRVREGEACEGAVVAGGAEIPLGGEGGEATATTRSDLREKFEHPVAGEDCPWCTAWTSSDGGGRCNCGACKGPDWFVKPRDAVHCRAVTKRSGGPCNGYRAEANGGFCTFHDPHGQNAQAASQRAGGRATAHNTRSRLDRRGSVHRKFETEGDVLTLLGDVANELAQGNLSREVAEQIRRVCSDMTKILRGPQAGRSSRAPMTGEGDVPQRSEAGFLEDRLGVVPDVSDDA